MLGIAIEPKATVFQKTDSTDFGFGSLDAFNEESAKIDACFLANGIKVTTLALLMSVTAAKAEQYMTYEWSSDSSATTAEQSRTVGGFDTFLSAYESAFETSREKSDLLVESVLSAVYQLDAHGYGRHAAQEIMLFIEGNFRRSSLSEANRLLELADVDRLSSRSLIGLIRSTSRLRDHLPAWGRAYIRARESIASQGKSPAALFVGLPNADGINASKTTG